ADGPGTGDLATDEYTGSLSSAPIGSYAYAFRASVDNGANWTYCDADGSTNGFSLTTAGRLTVAEPGPAFGSCQLQTSTPRLALRGGSVGDVDASVTAPAAIDAGTVTAAIGYGPVGTTPDTASWVWTAAPVVSGGGTTTASV